MSGGPVTTVSRNACVPGLDPPAVGAGEDFTATTGAAIMVVDDDALFRESLCLNLVDEGFRVVDFDNGRDALAHLQSHADVGVILLDWKMPEMDGLSVLHRLRADGRDVPVIFLTVLSDEIYEEAALEGGAVDFVEKSRSFSIVLKRIRLIFEGLKGMTSTPTIRPQVVRIGALQLWPESKRAAWHGEAVELTVREFDIVKLMAERAGHDVSYREIYDTVHGKGFVAGNGHEGLRGTVRTIIKRIRQKFRAVDDDFAAIENFPGFGYRWRRDGKG
ncbi:MAG: DNA-binding response regulator [Alphaproteobacteria bacterium]|nr:MAG: DNA-binding response regulator [Alphaproteobacteria bacterium]